MTYPSETPPNNRVNTTPMTDNHPSDHNLIADAISDVIAELGENPKGDYPDVEARLNDSEADLANHGHDYLSLDGGTLSGGLNVEGQTVIDFAQDVKGPGTGSLLVAYDGISSSHIAVDGNEIQAYANGSGGQLNLNIENPSKVVTGGDLQVKGTLTVNGDKAVYTKAEVDALLAARPLMKLCSEPTRVYDNRNGHKCKTWKKVQIPSNVGGVARSGAVAAYIQIVSVNAKGPGWIAIRPDGSNWQPVDDSPYSSMNVTTGENNSEHMLTQIGSNGAIEFYVYIGGSDSSTVGMDGFIVDVIALVF